MKVGDSIKLVYEPGETGWGTVVELPKGKKPMLVRITNVPLTDLLNIDDVVEAAPGKKDDRLHASRVISRAFEYKIGLDYPEPHTENYGKIRRALQAAKCKVEGMLPGRALVACNDQDVDAIVKKAGVDAVFPKSQPRLKPIQTHS
jgi:hypothetical protein